MKGEPATPDSQHLFDTAENTTKLSQTDAKLLHHFVAQLLYLSKQVRPEIQLVLYFLCTRVREPGFANYNKLERVVKYIYKVSFGLTLILSIHKSDNIQWYVDI